MDQSQCVLSGAANDTLEKLGLNLAELRKQTPLEQFCALGSAIDKMADANERVAAARAFFGRSGASLLSMFSAKGFGDAAKQVGIQAQILGRDAALFDDVSDKLALAGTKLTGFFIGVADRVVPVLKPLIDSFAAIDYAAIGQQVGDAIATVGAALAGANFGEIVLASIQLQLGRAINFFAGGSALPSSPSALRVTTFPARTNRRTFSSQTVCARATPDTLASAAARSEARRWLALQNELIARS